MLVNLFRWFVPVLVIASGLALCRVTAETPAADEPIAPERTMPWRIAPRYDLEPVASDEQLAAVLERMKPAAKPVNTNNIVHALRLWGDEAKFGDAAFLDGDRMRDYFLDDAAFRQIAGDDVPALFEIRDELVEVRKYQSGDPHRDTGAVHVDDLLATLAEIGVPLDAPLSTRGGDTTVRSLAEAAMRNFHRRQTEYEWSIISYGRYLFPTAKWVNRYGESLDADQLVDELVEQPLRRGVCSGTHRLEALVVLSQANEHAPQLSSRARRKLLAHLAHASTVLVASQHSQGYWNQNWSQGAAAIGKSDGGLADRILATGHHLEWLALAPPEVQPPRETIVRASQWLVRAMLEVDDEALARDYGPFSHAARALCLWRSKEPYAAWKSEYQNPKSEGIANIEISHPSPLTAHP
jgi:hypothetical protein